MSMLQPKLVLVQAPWCPYCKNMRPEWDALRKDLLANTSHVQVVEYDRDALTDLREEPKDPIIAALDAKEENGVVSTVPHIALVVFGEDGTPREVYRYSEYVQSLQQDDGNDAETPEPRTKASWLHFLRDALKQSLPDTSLKKQTRPQAQTQKQAAKAQQTRPQAQAPTARTNNANSSNSARRQQTATSASPQKRQSAANNNRQDGGGTRRTRPSSASANTSRSNGPKSGGGAGGDNWRRR